MSVLVCALASSSCAKQGSTRSAAAAKTQPAAALTEDSRVVAEAPNVMLTSEDDFAVRVVIGSVICSGALIEEDRVLTAHHCLSARSPEGHMEARNVEAEDVRVELGGDALPWGEVRVRAIVAPNCGYAAADGDIAILVLSRPLHGVATRAVELNAPPAEGETLVPVGFGRCAGSSDGIYRKRRAGLPLTRVTDRKLELQAAICPGDSGGPVMNLATSKIVGVVSRSAMDANETTLGLTELTRLDAYRPVFAAAAAIAAGTSPAELPPVECRH